jgi:hypothetical protein
MTLDTYAELFDEDLDDVADRLNAAIQTAADDAPSPTGRESLNCSNIVELGRIELPTYSMRTSRATNCAIAPCAGSTGYQSSRGRRNQQLLARGPL